MASTEIPKPTAEAEQNEQLREFRSDYTEKYGFHDVRDNIFETGRGLNEEIVREISSQKGEPDWMLEKRLEGYRHFMERPMPNWGGDLSEIDFQAIRYYIRPTDRQETTWEEVPEDIKDTFDKLGIPEAERKSQIGGVGAQYDSEVVYHSLRQEWERQGVLFLSPEEGIRQYPEIVQEYFGTIIPYNDNKFAALNTAVWSGGSFVYVPAGVHVDIPLQAYFRINSEGAGQFERTLIIVEEGAFVHYVEGCTAPTYSKESLHSAVVEIVVKQGGRCRYSTIQNWSNNVLNLVTKRAVAYRDATMEWVDGNLGSCLTMKYPAVILAEPGAHGEVLSIAFAGKGQHLDSGGKMVHAAPHTTSRIVSKSISKDGGRSTYRGLVRVYPGAEDVRSNVVCDALMLDDQSGSDTFPYMDIREDQVDVGHEASVSKVGEEQLFYLMSRGLDEDTAMSMIVNGFIEPIVKELPMEYAVEMNRLIELQMEGSIG